MAQKGLYPFSWSSPSMPDEANLKENPAADIARCGSSPTLFPPVVSLDAGVKPLGTPGTSSYAAEQVFTPCLNSLESHIPNVPTSFYGGNYLPGEASTPGFKNWVEQYYNCGIQLADHMRLNETGTFYVIGLGAKATSGLPDDPYENAFDSQSRHDRWLARIALDAQMAGSPPMDFTYDGYMKWSDATAATPDRVGDYVATPSPAELELIFQRIGLRVLLKLVS